MSERGEREKKRRGEEGEGERERPEAVYSSAFLAGFSRGESLINLRILNHLQRGVGGKIHFRQSNGINGMKRNKTEHFMTG